MPTINLVLKTITGEPVNGRLRVELEKVTSNTISVFVPSVQTVDVVNGLVSVTVPANIAATYWFGESDSVVLYKLGTLNPTTDGDFGTKVRTANGQTNGTQHYMTVSGGMLAAASPPVNPVTITIVNASIGKDGTVFVPIESEIEIDDLTSVYSVDLPYTVELYDPTLNSPILRLVQNSVRIGNADFTVPSSATGTFSVNNGAVVIIEA